jgi:hypothetical protein
MTEEELIDAVNERASYDERFRERLEQAVSTKNRSLIRMLIEQVIRAVFGAVADFIRRKAEEWLLSDNRNRCSVRLRRE